MELLISSTQDLSSVAKKFLDEFGHHVCFAFYAAMGSGKTTFITALLKAMGIPKTDGSPTYSLVNSYHSTLYGEVFHFDLYRIQNELEAYDIGIEEMLYGGGKCFIEWPEKIINLLPENTVSIYIHVNEDNSRTLKIIV
jgi:tRNA threonylcarbamoyladenosine biosynthesis protein TsaE